MVEACDKGTLRSVQSALNNIKRRGLKDALWNEGRGRPEGQSKTREPARNPCKTECAQPRKRSKPRATSSPCSGESSLVLLDAFTWLTDRSESRLTVRIQLPPAPSPYLWGFAVRITGIARACGIIRMFDGTGADGFSPVRARDAAEFSVGR
jgi:hypothetical protein